jgi:prepilin-type N-terminal cleavage/methylation domain-containing protein
MKRTFSAHPRATGGFSLIELLVVIGIIVILAAILYPVFQSVREKARQAQCRSNLHQIALAMREYRDKWNRYPFEPYYDTTAGRWLGGVSALYPDFISDKSVLICPDDRQIASRKGTANNAVYSSYNGMVKEGSGSTWEWETSTQTNPDGGATIADAEQRTYNCYGFSQEGYDCFTFATRPYASTLPAWLRNEGLSWRHYPRMYNRNAPDNTIICHCVHHRRFYSKELAKMDAVVTLGGTSSMVNVGQMSRTGTDAAHPSKWVSQKN